MIVLIHAAEQTVHHLKFQETMQNFGFRCEKLVMSTVVPSFRGRMVLYSCTMEDISKAYTAAPLLCVRRRPLRVLCGILLLSAVALLLLLLDGVRI